MATKESFIDTIKEALSDKDLTASEITEYKAFIAKLEAAMLDTDSKADKVLNKENAKKIDLKFPDISEVLESPIKDLHKTWNENHKKLQEYIENNNVPFFALHGTSKQNNEKICSSKSAMLEIATFYEKKYNSEEFLYKLYAANAYVTGYANKSDYTAIGKIIILNVEQNKKANITYPWEHLLKKGVMTMSLNLDSDSQVQIIQSLEKSENHFWRSDIFLNKDNFDDHYQGAIDLSDQYFSTIFDLKVDGIAREIMKLRLLLQWITLETFKLL